MFPLRPLRFKSSFFLLPRRFPMHLKLLPLLIAPAILCSALHHARAADPPKRLVLVAGKPSHGPRAHEFNAGTQLLAKCLRGTPQVETHVVLNGWPADEQLFDRADAIVFYMDGGGGHEL